MSEIDLKGIIELDKVLIEKDKEIERLNKENENLTNIVANKIIKDYDIETPLKDELNKERIKNVNLSDENNILKSVIKEVREYIGLTDEDREYLGIYDVNGIGILNILDKVGSDKNE